LPDVDTFNIVDDSLVRAIGAKGALTADIARRVQAYITSAEAGGADFILVTCSSIGPAVEACAAFSAVPVLRVDPADGGSRGADGLADRRDRDAPHDARPDGGSGPPPGGRGGEVHHLDLPAGGRGLCGADGRRRRRPRRARGGRRLREAGDGGGRDLCLAQASMSRVVEALSPADRSVPILASPALAIAQLAKLL
jgi:hypothetical protein